MLLIFYIKQLEFNLKKHFIYLYIFNLIYILYLIKNLFNININIKIFINHFFA